MFISTSYDHRISRHVGAHHVSCIRPADLPTRHPTRLDQDNSTAWPGYLPASHLLMRLTPSFRSHAHHHTAPEGATQRLGWLVSQIRSEEHTSELQSRGHLVCGLLRGRIKD